MHGTCIECSPQKVDGEDEPYVFSFFTDISVDPDVIEQVQHIQTNVKTTLTNLTKYLQRWKKFRQIWISDKVGLAVLNPVLCSIISRCSVYT